MGVLSFILAPIIVIVAIVVAVILWVVRGQNTLVHADELCGNALSQIGVQQASRWDALTTLADLTKAYSDQEHKVLMDVIHARQGISNTSTAEQVDAQEGMLQQAIGRIGMLAEAYPDIKTSTVYLNTMNNVRGYEENVRMSRMVYNDTVTRYNRLVRSMPGSLVAGGLGFTVRGYLQDDPAKAAMPDMVR